MKNMLKIYAPVIATAFVMVLTGCNKVLDLKPINEISDASFWKNSSQFQLAANEFYTYLRTFTDVINDNPHADRRGDFFWAGGSNAFSNGTNAIPLTDGNWNTAFTRIRAINYLLDRAATYPNQSEIAQYVAEAKFFRAYIYFDLLQQYGDVPIVDKLVSINSPELTAGRDPRDKVVDFIVSDLEAAIAILQVESAIGTNDKGRVSKGAAQSFLGRVTLYEGTWQKSRNNLTRANDLLDKAISNSGAVITSSEYQIFAPAVLGDSAQKYMFILENQKSNPASINKSANKEYILANRYDQNARQIGFNVTKTVQANVLFLTRKFANMYLCQDGLPIDKSPLFQGYATTTSEFIARDNRMRYNMVLDGQYLWSNQVIGSRVTWVGDAADIANSLGKFDAVRGTGYHTQKWAAERQVPDNQEGYDYPVIRYAEVLLNYAEAVFERNGTISDADLDISLNLVRNRVNKSMPKLSNALVNGNGLDMRTEIRRERNIELYFEGFRVDDLKRWKTAETEMPMDLQGITWTGTQFQTRWPAISSSISGGVYRVESNRKWADKNYLLPIPSQQIQLNSNLAQSPGWQ
jgi:hypothetical protein